jgi:hypothetical protein
MPGFYLSKLGSKFIFKNINFYIYKLIVTVPPARLIQRFPCRIVKTVIAHFTLSFFFISNMSFFGGPGVRTQGLVLLGRYSTT